MENKNFIIMLMAVMLCMMGYQQFFVVPKKQQELAAKQQAEETLKAAAGVSATAAASAALATPVTAAPTVKEESFYSFSYPQADIKFSSKGAGIKEYIYKDIVGDVDLTPYKGEGYFGTFNDLDFSLSSQSANSISFTSVQPQFTINKTYTFNDNGVNNLTLSLVNKSKTDIAVNPFSFSFGPGLGTVKSELNDNERESKAVFTVQEKDRKKLTLNNRTSMKAEKSPVNGGWIWAGVQNRYFLTALVPQNWQGASLDAGKTAIGTKPRLWGLLGTSEMEGPWLKINVAAQTVKAGETLNLNSDFYFGPKDFKKLETMPYGLDRSVEFGFFGSLGKLARSILDWIYKYTGNYGFSIIIFALLLQVAMLKLTMMQQKSSLVMKKIQPEMKKIQENYKDDQAAMQRAMLDLYKKHKFNPASGCLPLLLQLPIFLALFNALRTSWDLHGAPFALWITDLSSKDPYYVLPLAMGGVMLLQQRMTMPMGGDPTQTAMLKWMPVIFTFLFMNFPAGLVLYWLTNSVVSFSIQLYMNKKHG